MIWGNMNKRKLPVCVLLAAMLAAQTSCKIEGGIIGYLMDQYSEQEEEIPEEEIPEEETTEAPVHKERVEAKLCADQEWAVSNAPDFTVSNAEELISAAYWVNNINNGKQSVTITLNENIDLSDYLWEPMGMPDDNKFSGEIDGGGHTISGLSIPGGYRDTGFVGCASSLDIHDITFTDAEITGTSLLTEAVDIGTLLTEPVFWDPEVRGTSNTGIVCGELDGEHTWRNIHVQGSIITEAKDGYGAIGGRTPGIGFDNCNADVTVNGDDFNYLDWQDYEDDQKIHENDYTVEGDGSGCITRTHQEDESDKLRWVVYLNGNSLCRTDCKNEYSNELNILDIGELKTGLFSVYLEAFFGKGYVRCSNIFATEFSFPDWDYYEDCERYSLLDLDPYEIDCDPDMPSRLKTIDTFYAPFKVRNLSWVYVVDGKEAIRKPFVEGEYVDSDELMEEAKEKGVKIEPGNHSIFIFVVGDAMKDTDVRISNVYPIDISFMLDEITDEMLEEFLEGADIGSAVSADGTDTDLTPENTSSDTGEHE